ncbi:PD-(D/E)XK nuclease family protein [Lacticaseibacillus zhaodongensis]|uniref:PD-(D/E)XK nuclease family protein n=1 Tax=Lacticaseibacillus zhaodongensis TaxID=2668065 RepID=UPI0012D2B6E5|nr:PD-(D/E)XK nuclease family protein [Lacticaseibacillus zhaodongensis]
MALNFILGSGTRDHDQVLADSMARVLQKDPAARVLMLVPNHIKFESEVSVLGALKARLAPTAQQYAQNRVQIMSFSRLAWFFLNHDAIYQQPRLSNAAAAMRLAKAMQDQEKSLRLFAGQIGNPGFTTRLQKQVAELQMGNITATDLRAAISGMTGDRVSATTDSAQWHETVRGEAAKDRHLPKLIDLETILEEYERSTTGTVSQADLLTALGDKLSRSDLSHMYVYFSHFNAFAAQELALVEILMQRAAAVSVALVTDQASPDEPLAPDLYLPAKRLYHQLLSLAKRDHVRVRPDQFAPLRKQAATMRNVERYFKAATALSSTSATELGVEQTAAGQPDFAGLDMYQANSTYAELSGVARTIRREVQTQGRRYKDFLVVARHLKPYETIVNAVFKEFNLPVFVDHERQMNAHPLLVFLDNLFAIRANNYDYNSIFALLRTELLQPAEMNTSDFRSAVDTTENHVLATGIRGKRWTDDKDWTYYTLFNRDDNTTVSSTDTHKTEQINQIHDLIRSTLPAFYAELDAATTGTAIATAVYNFLDHVGVRQQLQNWRDAAQEAGDLSYAQGSEQAWQVFCDLLDDFVSTWGESTIDPDQFIELLDAGFGSATYTQIPSTMDQVVVSETGLTRLNHAQHVFIIGATSAVMPDSSSDSDLLNSDDRHALAASLPDGCFLPETGPDNALTEPFLNYLSFVAPAAQLTLSYPVHSDNDNKESPYLEGLRQVAGCSYASWEEARSSQSVGRIIGSPRSLLSDTIVVVRELADAKIDLGPAWQAVIKALRQTPLAALSNRLLASIDYTNAAGHLSPGIAQQLYGRHLAVSISRLESFYKDPFEYFLQYGLGLAPRREFQLTPADSGTLFHAVMDGLLRAAQTEGGIAQMSANAVAKTVRQLLQQELEKPEYAILSSSARMQFITELINATLQRTAWAVRSEQSNSGLHASTTELSFGMGAAAKGLPPLQLPLGDDRHVIVRGRIDRLDTIPANNKTGFMVVDYKSSKHDFSPADAYYGLGMQMLTYMEAVIRAGSMSHQEMIPVAGMFMQIQDPRLKFADLKRGADITDLLLNSMRMKGLLVATPVLTELDATLRDEDGGITPGKSSKYFPLKVNKSNGKVAKGTTIVTVSQIIALLNNNDELIRHAAQQILAGVIELAPARYDQKTDVITKSDYSSIMQFDPALKANRYKQLQSLDLEGVLQRISQGELPYPGMD